MKEFEVQKTFFNSIRDVTPKNSPALDVYEELVYIRFFDVISSCYPIFTNLIGEERLSQLVKLFIKDKPKDPFIWNSPKEFLKFLKREKLITSKRELEILEFELLELKLYINKNRTKNTPFSWKKRLKLSKNAKIFKFFYGTLKSDFLKKEKSFYLIYQNPKNHEVYHFEITAYMFEFLKLLRNNTPIRSLKLVNKRFNVTNKKGKKILEDGLKYLSQNSILN